MFRVPVIRKQEKPVLQHRTAVAGLCAGCGVSFAAGLLAAGTAALPGAENASSDCGCTLAELGTPYFYTALNIEKRFAEGDFVFYEDALEKRRSLLAVKNSFRRLDLLLRRPDAAGLAPSICACKMPGTQVVFDLSGFSEDALDEVLPEMDSIFIVLDPLPSRLLPAEKKLRRLIQKYPGARLVANRMNKGVPSAELRRFLGGSFISLPFADPALIYKAEYGCELFAHSRQASDYIKRLIE